MLWWRVSRPIGGQLDRARMGMGMGMGGQLAVGRREEQSTSALRRIHGGGLRATVSRIRDQGAMRAPADATEANTSL
ncbi:hypothetical protein ADK66_23760 [Micromonospora sp. NRRL B-16802]|nr:hypothetical protein ADK66_23760 [Micromonospora sp. NRRL B-16802]